MAIKAPEAGATQGARNSDMKVKVGDKIYDGKNQPVMVILSKGEKQQIADMLLEATKYCIYPSIKLEPILAHVLHQIVCHVVEFLPRKRYLVRSL